MPQNPGESTLCTLGLALMGLDLSFGDVHYFFCEPARRPLHHRFDKASYVYLYSAGIKGRVEIANNAGTPQQDAFSGCRWTGLDFDTVHLEYSYKHSCLVTLTTNIPDTPNIAGATPPPPQTQDQQWKLPVADLKNEGYYLTKLHTVDIYFWTRDDALLFVESAKKVLPTTQMKIRDAPTVVPPAHAGAMSSVVQKLEQVAVSDPYHPVESGNTSAVSLKNPAQSGGDAHDAHATEPPSNPAGYAPLVYNPAAPPAPEPIKHREKTPPPPDAAGGTGLAAAATSDYGQAFVPAPLQHQGTFPAQKPGQTPAYFTGPPQPQSSATPPGPPAGSPAQVGSPYGKPQRASTFSGTPPTTGSTGPPAGQQYTQSFAPPPTGSTSPPSGQQYGQGFPPPPPLGQQPTPVQQGYPAQYGAPQSQYYSQQPGQQYYGQPQQQQPPIGGYSNYTYSSAPGAPQQQPGANDVHNQLYRPTQTEATVQHHDPPSQGQPQPTGRLETGAAKVEKRLGGFLKKLEKKIG
ncbi:MAG: hypothetical protein M1839_007369 [Geoglossum umbratile]|nr:MAG: hypothetical protein M1839_007369 [Geoglossum umbratile]